MDNNYKWIRLMTLDGWVLLNTEYIESVKKINKSIKLRMTSGESHLIHVSSEIQRLQKIIPLNL